jgi:uncharacterized protein DUF4154
MSIFMIRYTNPATNIKLINKLSNSLFNLFKGATFAFLVVLISASYTTEVIAEEQTKTYSESTIKAALVYNILHFIDWQPKDLVICVYQPDDEDVSSFHSLPAQTKSGKTLEVKFLHRNGNALIQNNCHVIFVTRKGGDDTYEILNETKNTQRLTIGESDHFIKQGGMINFIRKDLTIKFEINVSALNQADLKISSQVLRIADRVYMSDDDE